MSVLNFLNQIFIVVLPLAFITTAIWKTIEMKEHEGGKDNKSTTESPQKNKAKWENAIDVLLIFSFIILIMVAFVLILKSPTKYKWIIVFLSIPVGLQYLTGTCIAIGTLGNVVRSNDDGCLSNQERNAIQVIAYVVFLLDIINPYERLLEYIEQFSSNMVSDALTVLIFVFFSFIYTFLIIVLISTPLFCGIHLLKIIGKYLPLKEKLKRIGDYFVKHFDNKVENKPYLIRVIKYIQRLRCRVKLLLYFLLPVVYLFDIIKMCMLTLLSMIQSSIGYIVILFRIIKNATKAILLWLLKLSDRHIVAVSFRLALIFALVSIVILNRYQPIFKEYEKSTAVFEFLASSIIIPTVFEWIYSIRSAK